MATLSSTERQRYARHLALPDFGEAAQLRLKEARVLVIGAGGLGCPILAYLTAAGVGHIGIVDFDQVERSNLQRQVLYTGADIGQPKAEVAVVRLQGLNPFVQLTAYCTALTPQNALDIIASYDIVVDGTDNFPTRYLTNDACLLSGKPLVYGSIYRYEGQVSVFNQLLPDGSRGPNYRDLFPQPPPPELVPNCAEGGVIGVLPGIIGSLQANETIKLASGVGTTLSGKLYVLDAQSMLSRTLRIQSNTSAYEVKELIDYEQFCNPAAPQVPEWSPSQLKAHLEADKPLTLLDVREPHEYKAGSLPQALSIPLATLSERWQNIKKTEPVVVVCRSGKRSAQAVSYLQGLEEVECYSLAGGMLAWRSYSD